MVTLPSASARIHSWLSAYLSSLGTFTFSASVGWTSFDQDFAVAYERRLDDLGGERLAAHRDSHEVTVCSTRGHARERDRLAERGGERAARDLAAALGRVHGLVRAQDAPGLEEQQPHELRARRRGNQRRLADEVARACKIDR